jgi:CDP-glycerol glycerophosphotransferase (TagB/SpsB family)
MWTTAKKVVRASLAMAAFYASRFYRRDPRLWVFGARHAFGGNAHYFFLWVSHHEPQIEAVWITADRSIVERIRSAGLRAELSGTSAARSVQRRAGVYLYNDRVSEIGAKRSNGALLVNLWHGSGLKNIASHHKKSVLYNLHQGRLSSLRVRYERIEHPARAVFVSTSPAIAARFSKAYDVPLSDCPIVGTPRLDASVDRHLRARSMEFGNYAEFDAARKNNREIYIYMPTYRPGNRKFLGDALPDPERLSAILKARSAVMFVKLHARDKSGLAMLESGEVESERRILPWPPGCIFYNVINDIDCLITDYSSVMFDFIAIKSGGMLLYPFDIDQYVDERGFYFPYQDSVAGHRVDNFPALCDAIASGQALTQIDAPQLARVRDRVWEGSKVPASPHVSEEIKRRAGLRRCDEKLPLAYPSALPA